MTMKLHPARITTLGLLVVAFALHLPAAAQIAPPRIAELSPVGAMRGTTVEVTLRGVHIGRGTALLIEGEGITVEAVTPETPEPPKVKEGEQPPLPPLNPEGTLTARLRIDPDAEPGVRGVRVVTPAGVSDVARFAIGRWPEVAEQEPNNTPEQAQAVTLPACIVGRIDPAEDSDCFRFRGRAGQTLVCDLLSARLETPLDAILTLFDAAGKEIGLNDDGNDLDPLLVATLPADGDYVLVLRDLRYRGGNRHHYRLSIGEIPYVTAAFPAGGRAGETTELQLTGYNLGSAASARVTLPAAIPPQPLVRALPLASGPSNPISIAVDEGSDILEAEGRAGSTNTTGDRSPSGPTTNDDPASAEALPVPGTVSGRLLAVGGAESDTDCYRFHAEKGQRLTLEVMARRLGSELDSVLAILDSTGNEIASNDDAEGKDSRVEFTAPETGDYVARVRDLYNRQGPGFFYRLRAIAGPDFGLTFTPDRPAVGRGGRVPVTVKAKRLNGFEGEIALEVSGLPEGVRLIGPARIRAGRSEAHLVLAADPGAPLQAALLRVTGTIDVEGRVVRRLAQGQEAIGPEDNRRYRSVPLAAVAVAEPPDAVVTAAPESVTLAPGGSVEITVTVARRAGGSGSSAFEQNLPLVLLGLPPGVSAEAPEIPKDKTEGKITLKAEGGAAPAEADLVIAGRVSIDNERQTFHAAAPIALNVERNR
jgi:hypothetical protein